MATETTSTPEQSPTTTELIQYIESKGFVYSTTKEKCKFYNKEEKNSRIEIAVEDHGISSVSTTVTMFDNPTCYLHFSDFAISTKSELISLSRLSFILRDIFPDEK